MVQLKKDVRSIESESEFRGIVYTVGKLLLADEKEELYKIFSKAEKRVEETGYDNWNGGLPLFTVFLTIDVETFIQIRDRIEKIEADILASFETATRHLEHESVSNIRIVPKAQNKIDWSKVSGFSTKEEIIRNVEYLRNVMTSVSTGGPRIQVVNQEYKERYGKAHKTLERLGLQNPNPYHDLWDWYGKWSTDFPTYRERRAYIREMFSSLLQTLEGTEEPEIISVTVDLTDWERIERSVQEIKTRKSEAKTEEQCQVVGHLCRETIITLAQAVFDPEKHPVLDKTKVSKTDAKRMLEAYIAIEFSGTSNAKLRKYAKATLDLASDLTHKRTATREDVSICTAATLSLINLIGTIEGRL